MRKARRNWLWFLRWRRQGPVISNLEIDEVGTTLTAAVGSTGHTATVTATNLDGSPATNVSVSFVSTEPTVCSVDGTTGVLTMASAGTATVRGIAQRDGFQHVQEGIVTVTDPNTGDFTATLNLA